MAVRDTPADTRLGFWSTGLAVFAFWNVATLIGALAGNAISDPRALGLDAAAPAAFLALLAPRLKTREPQAIAALAAVAALVSVPLVPAGTPVLVAAAVAAAALRRAGRRRARARASGGAAAAWRAGAESGDARSPGSAARDVGRDPASPPAGATRSSSPGSRSRSACSTAPRVQRVARCCPWRCSPR